jgi:hypothetical protein
VYESEDDPCDFCVQRHRDRKKVWGALRTAEEIESAQASTDLSYPVSFIANSNLSPAELFDLRFLFIAHHPWPLSVHGTIMHYLWATYGFDFSHASSESLRYSAMAFATVDQIQLLGGVLPVHYYEYVSHFHASLLSALRTDTVNETHLFALFIMILSSFRAYAGNGDMSESDGIFMYYDPFLAVLGRLVQQRAFPHQKELWRFSLSFLRRSCENFNKNQPSTRTRHVLLRSMHFLDGQLPGNQSYETILFASIAGFDAHIANMSLHSWNVTDILLTIRANFFLTYGEQTVGGPSIQMESDFVHLLHSVRSRKNGFEKYSHLEDAFEVQPDNLPALI